MVNFDLFCGDKSLIKSTGKNPIFKDLAFHHRYLDTMHKKSQTDQTDKSILKKYPKLPNNPQFLTVFTPWQQALKYLIWQQVTLTLIIISIQTIVNTCALMGTHVYF